MKIKKYFVGAVVMACVGMFSACGCKHENAWKISETIFCEKTGSAKYHCDDCNADFEKIVDAQGHDYSVFLKNTATCTSSGYDIYKCSRCDSKIEKNYTAALGHDYEKRLCKNCKKADSSYSKLEVSYSSGSFSYSYPEGTGWENMGVIYRNSSYDGYDGVYKLTLEVNPGSKSVKFEAWQLANKYLRFYSMYYITIVDESDNIIFNDFIILTATGGSTNYASKEKECQMTQELKEDGEYYINVSTTFT